MKTLLFLILGYLTFFIPLLTVYFYSYSKNIKISKNSKAFFLLSLASVLPYLSVGKSTNIFAFEDWSYRQFLPGCLLMSMAIGFAYFDIQPQNGVEHKKIAKFLLIALLIWNLSFLYMSFNSKMFRQEFEEMIINELVQATPRLDKDQIVIVADFIPGPEFRPYESNYILFKYLEWDSGALAFRSTENADLPLYRLDNETLSSSPISGSMSCYVDLIGIPKTLNTPRYRMLPYFIKNNYLNLDFKNIRCQ
jgi:hypothetical protein